MRSALCLALILAACHRAEPGDDEDDKPAPAKVTCVAAKAATIDDAIEVSGVIAPPPRMDAIVGSPIAGRVGSLAVEEGDKVEANALIATIEDPSLPAGAVEARAGVSSAQAGKLAADQEVARQERLVASGIGARKDLDDAKAKQAAAIAELEAAGARSGLAATRNARRELRAPRAGVVLHVWRKVGETVDGTSATPIAEVADTSVLEVHAQVMPAQLALLADAVAGIPPKPPAKADDKKGDDKKDDDDKPDPTGGKAPDDKAGQGKPAGKSADDKPKPTAPVTLHATVHVLGNDDALQGTLVRSAPAVDPSTLLGLVRVRLDSGSAPIGVAATAEIVLAQRPGVTVPASALRRSQVGEDEAVVCDKGVARVRSVQVGKRTDKTVEISDGIKAGEQVVTDHVLGLQEGQELQK